MTSPATTRTVVQLYRDCLRLVRHIAPGSSAKSFAVRTTVRSEFRKPCPVAQVEARKANAIRALSNYLLAVAAPKDQKIQGAVDDFHGRSIPDQKKEE